MSIQYAGGTRYNNTFTCTTGTRAEIVAGIETALTAAGWTTVSGGGTGDVLMQCVAAGTLQCRVRLHDPGSGSVAHIYFRNPANTIAQTNPLPLLTAASKVYRVVANRYSFYVFTAGASAGREFAAGGILYAEPSLQTAVTECIWAMGNGNNDSNTTVESTFRTALSMVTTTSGTATLGRHCFIVNGSKYEQNTGGSFITVGNSGPRLVVPVGAFTDAYAYAYRWHDDSLIITDPLFAWGASNASDEAKIRGQLYDAFVLMESVAADTVYTHDGNSWIAITHNNAGSSSQALGTLFVKIP